jgi:hypothetical protein
MSGGPSQSRIVSDQRRGVGPAGIEWLALGEHVPDGGREFPGDLGPGDLAAPLAAEAALGVLVLCAIDLVPRGVGGRLNEGPAQVLGPVLGEGTPIVPAARLAEERA